MTDRARQLRREFQAHQEQMLHAAIARQRRNRLKGVIAGTMTGLVAVMIAAGFTIERLEWRYLLLEPLLCGAAGYWVARLGGGLLKGFLFFAVAYLVAVSARGTTFDITLVFSQGEVQGRAAIQGYFMSMCIVIGCGGLIGNSMDR